MQTLKANKKSVMQSNMQTHLIFYLNPSWQSGLFLNFKTASLLTKLRRWKSLLVDTRLISLYYHLGNNYIKCCRHNLIIQHLPAATEDFPSILSMGKGCGLSSGLHDRFCPLLLCQQCSSTPISVEGCCWDDNGNSTIRSHQPSGKSHLWWLLGKKLPLITKGKVGKSKLFWQIQATLLTFIVLWIQYASRESKGIFTGAKSNSPDIMTPPPPPSNSQIWNVGLPHFSRSMLLFLLLEGRSCSFLYTVVSFPDFPSPSILLKPPPQLEVVSSMHPWRCDLERLTGFIFIYWLCYRLWVEAGRIT